MRRKKDLVGTGRATGVVARQCVLLRNENSLVVVVPDIGETGFVSTPTPPGSRRASLVKPSSTRTLPASASPRGSPHSAMTRMRRCARIRFARVL